MSVDWILVMRMIKELRQEVRSLRARVNDEDSEEESSVDEPVTEFAPDNPLMGGGVGSLQFITIVATADEATRTILGRVALPTTDTSTFWVADPSNSILYPAKIPAGQDMPEAGDTVLITFTGLTSLGALYGVFGAGGGGATQYRLKSVHADMLVCRTLSVSLVEGSEDVKIAKAWKQRVTPFDGVTSFGITYAYSTNYTARTVTTTTGSSQVQAIVPAFRADVDLIYAISTQTSVPDSAGGYLTLIDMNNDQRGWAGPL